MDAAQEFRRHAAECREIVVTSGQLIPRESELPETGRFLPKPYDPAQVVNTLWEMIP